MVDIIPETLKPGGRYNATEAAALLGCNRTSIYRWTQKGLLHPKPHRTSGWPMYRGSELIALHGGKP